MTRFAPFALLLLGFSPSSTPEARACENPERCSCVWGTTEPAEKRIRAQRAVTDIVLRGSVIDTTVAANGDRFAHLQVAGWWQGAWLVTSDTVAVRVSRAVARHNCELDLELRREYVLFARRDSAGVVSTGMCSGTRRIDQAKVELKVLGPALKPTDLRPR